jgi:hypothetical protein
MNILGLKTKSISLKDDVITIILQDGKTVSIHAHGDCCSRSFIESIDDESVFNDATITQIEIVSGETKEHEYWNVHKWTFYKITTTKGMATISMRNESNGYYDGYLSVSPDQYEWDARLEDGVLELAE